MGDLVLLQQAVIQWVMNTLTNEVKMTEVIKTNGLNVSPRPFVPVLPPLMISHGAIRPNGSTAAE